MSNVTLFPQIASRPLTSRSKTTEFQWRKSGSRETGVTMDTVRMLSYEDIFNRHHPRPLSYLPRSLESPIVTRRSPALFRPPVLVRRPRPLSSSDLDVLPRVFASCPKVIKTSPQKAARTPLAGPPRTLSDNYRLSTALPDRHLYRREIPLCTPDDLLDIIREPTGYYALPTDPWNEVYPDIYISDAPTALCTSVLKRIGITHVLNAAQGREKNCGQVNTTNGFYLQSGIQFLGVPAFDNIVFKIHPYFEEAATFIDDGLKSKGKVLVHCRAGISRSATLVCAFLMLKRGLTAQEAVRTVRKNRAIIPNDGFLQQLCDLNDKLKRKSKH